MPQQFTFLDWLELAIEGENVVVAASWWLTGKFAYHAIKRLIRNHHVNRGINLFALLGFPWNFEGKPAIEKNRIPAMLLLDGGTSLLSSYTTNRTRVHNSHPHHCRFAS